MNFRFQIFDIRFWITDFGFQLISVDFRFCISDFVFQILNVPISDFGFQVLDFRFQTVFKYLISALSSRVLTLQLKLLLVYLFLTLLKLDCGWAMTI